MLVSNQQHTHAHTHTLSRCTRAFSYQSIKVPSFCSRTALKAAPRWFNPPPPLHPLNTDSRSSSSMSSLKSPSISWSVHLNTSPPPSLSLPLRGGRLNHYWQGKSATVCLPFTTNSVTSNSYGDIFIVYLPSLPTEINSRGCWNSGPILWSSSDLLISQPLADLSATLSTPAHYRFHKVWGRRDLTNQREP